MIILIFLDLLTCRNKELLGFKHCGVWKIFLSICVFFCNIVEEDVLLHYVFF